MERRAPQKTTPKLDPDFHRQDFWITVPIILNLFFNEDWESKYRIISYGHDIEASWLLHEAAIELGDNEILQKVEPLVQKVAIAAEDGLLANGSSFTSITRMRRKPTRTCIGGCKPRM